MNGINDDVRLPFSVLDPIVGDVFSVLWEPEMIRETGSALKILTGEVLSQIGMTVLQATIMTGLMSALQWPVSASVFLFPFPSIYPVHLVLTKLGYLIDNPWSNALDRAKAAGRVLADVLIQRHLGVRPITLIGFSLGARVIFYALLELAKQKQFGIVQDVFLLGATLTVSQKSWSTPEQTDDDDLPPRLDSSSTTLRQSENAPTPSRTSTPPNDPTATSELKLPLHAGFDLSAIKNVLQEVEHGPGKLVLRVYFTVVALL